MKPIVNYLKNKRISKVLSHVSGRLLDVGCGEGNELCRRYLTSFPSYQAIGVDICPWSEVDIIIENSAALPFEDRSFDTITCVAALNHIPERVAFLREVRRLLMPDGKFIMTMIPPLLSTVWHRLIAPWDHDQTGREWEHGEVMGFTEEEVFGLFSEAGLKCVYKQRFILNLNCLYIAAI